MCNQLCATLGFGANGRLNAKFCALKMMVSKNDGFALKLIKMDAKKSPSLSVFVYNM